MLCYDLRDCAIDRPSDVFLFIMFKVWIVYTRAERSVHGNLLICNLLGWNEGFCVKFIN